MSDTDIHPTAIIHEGAKIGKGTKIGPYSIVGPNVVMGENNLVRSHVLIEGYTEIGNGNDFFQFSSIGAVPQDYSYKGEPTKVKIGDNNVFREFITVNAGTLKQDGITIIGSNSLFMAYVHFGHDTVVGNQCTIANSTNIAGHVVIGDNTIIGGGTQIAQFVKLGRGSYIGGASAIDKDVPTFCYAVGNRSKLKGVNIIGMRRQDYPKQIISEVIEFFRNMESSGLAPATFINNSQKIEEFSSNDVIQEIIQEIKETKIGIVPFVA